MATKGTGHCQWFTEVHCEAVLRWDPGISGMHMQKRKYPTRVCVCMTNRSGYSVGRAIQEMVTTGVLLIY